MDINKDEQSFNEVDVTMELKDIANDVQTFHIPKKNGHWTGEKGESLFELDDEYVNKDQITGKDIKEEYDFTGIEYKNKEADFSEVMDDVLSDTEIDGFSSERLGKDGTFDKAIQSYADKFDVDIDDIKAYLYENNLTLHELQDRKTIQAIPTTIHSAFPHSGGISVQKSLEKKAEEIEDSYGKIKLYKDFHD